MFKVGDLVVLSLDGVTVVSNWEHDAPNLKLGIPCKVTSVDDEGGYPIHVDGTSFALCELQFYTSVKCCY